MPKIDICLRKFHKISGGVICSADMHYVIMAGDRLIHKNEVFGKTEEHHTTFLVEDVPMDSIKLIYGCDSDYAILTANIVSESASRINDHIYAIAEPTYTPIPCVRVGYRGSTA